MSNHLRSVPIVLAICACAKFSTAAPASFLQPPLPGGSGFFSGPGGDQSADNFSFAQLTKVTSVRWWGTYLNNPPTAGDLFTVRIFAPDVGNVPQPDPSHEYSAIAATRTNSGLTDEFGDPIYRYEAQLPTANIFSPGTVSYFSVLNASSNPWYWQASTNSGSNWFREFEGVGSTWFATNSGNLSFQLIGGTPPSGDYNSDFTVNHTDYGVWRQAFGSTQLAADGNVSGRVDAADYVVWRKNFGASVGSSSFSMVPEPSAQVFVVSAVIAGGILIRFSPRQPKAASKM